MSEPENPKVPVVTEMAGKVKESQMACRNNCRRKKRKEWEIRGRMCESGKEKVREAEVKTPEVAEDISPCNPILEHWHGNRNGIVTDIVQAPETSGNGGGIRSEKDRSGGESKVDFTRRKFAGTMSVIIRRVRHGKPEPEQTREFGRFRKPAGGVQGRKRTGQGPEEDELAE
ncbi:hypothetical protein K438DRAFT_1755969 [Mycena galopus ATCC 62051]|nr:hypothetical protein K438DRAFT_1755969 [Mycena galopus ATCC 62051]